MFNVRNCTSGLSLYFSVNFCRRGNSSRQYPHQEAQKFKNVTLPFRDSTVQVLPFKSTSSNGGTGSFASSQLKSDGLCQFICTPPVPYRPGRACPTEARPQPSRVVCKFILLTRHGFLFCLKACQQCVLVKTHRVQFSLLKFCKPPHCPPVGGHFLEVHFLVVSFICGECF